MSELKPCPFRVHGERTASLTVEGEWFYNEVFMPCLRNECACFHDDCGDPYCDRNGAYMRLTKKGGNDALEKVAELYPWRVPGDRDSYSQYNEAWQDALNRAENAIGNLPSAQPEITRCKDCEHWTNDDCPFAWGKVEDAFCSYAERRTDGSDR